MDSMKIGRLIAQLRKEKGLTQKDIAQSLGVVNKTVSKWECGLGCPDLSLWPALSQILGADMAQMMEGEIVRNRPDSGNLCKARFYVCADCGNILVSTAGASVFCCGRKLEAAAAQDAQEGAVAFSQVDGEWFVQIDHPMEKTHSLSFAALVKGDEVLLRRLYPEQEAQLRLPFTRMGRLFFYCTRDGLFSCALPRPARRDQTPGI